MTRISPFARFPNNISIFHVFATNVKVLEAVNDAMTTNLTNPEDPRVTMLPLMFLYKSKGRHIPGLKQNMHTPVHLALDKQSPRSFEIMLSLLKNQTKVCVTTHLLDRIEAIISQGGTVVNDFFDESFFVTD